MQEINIRLFWDTENQEWQYEADCTQSDDATTLSAVNEIAARAACEADSWFPWGLHKVR